MASLDDIPADYLSVAQAALAERCPELELRQEPQGLTLVGDGMELRADFAELMPRAKQGRLQQELLVKAAKVKKDQIWGCAKQLTCEHFTECGIGRHSQTLRAIDATAGLGEDSFLLAAAGFEVTLCEQDPVIFALLVDALMRAQQSENEELVAITARMTPVHVDSIHLLRALMVDVSSPLPDVVLLDPMFPERTKSALVKKKFQLFHHLQQPCTEEDGATLLRTALDLYPRKVIIKRPPKGPYLADHKPSYSISGKAVRYDCIALPPLASWTSANCT